MQKINSKSNVEVIFDRGSVEIVLSGIVTARTLDAILRALSRQEVQGPGKSEATDLIVDLTRVNVIRPGGAVGLVCLGAAFMTNKMRKLASTSRIHLRRPPQNVLDYLTKIGFFTQMSVNADLQGHGDLVRLEDKLQDRYRKKRADGILDEHFDIEHPVIWPIHLIARKQNQRSRRDFEDICQGLINDAADHFDALFASPDFNFGKKDQHNFLLANYELYMNVYDHSGSSGLAMIHARPRWGTFFCCYDIGIGIRESVNASPNVKTKFDTDYDAIKWAVVEGNSSKLGGNGVGLNTVEDFVLSRNGIIEIRSGECLLQRKASYINWKYFRLPWFPGTQINAFVPVTASSAEVANVY